ncbi:MAG: hypothetical protein AAGK78_14165, partial [Planctomycetota bacterium]
NRSGRPIEGGPGISVRLEDWQQTSQQNGVFILADADISFFISADAVDAEDVDAVLLAVDEQLHAAMMTDQEPFLGLDFVYDVDRVNFPTDANAEGNLPTASAIARYRVLFQYPRNDIGA